MAAWSEEDKAKALAIASTAGPAEASRATGVPAGTIRSWVHRERHGPRRKKEDARAVGKPRTNKKLKAAADECMDIAKVQAADVVADRIAEVAEGILSAIELSLTKITDTIMLGPVDGEYNSAWLRALVGVMAQGVEKHQLLLGQPTSRQALEGQVTNRHEYDITQRIIEDPGSRELARDLFRRAINPGLGSGREE
jgi:transposase-like protein